MPTPIVARLGLWNLFAKGEISSSPAQAGAVYSGDRNGKPRCTLVESVAPMVQSHYLGESGEDVNVDVACLFDHNQLAANTSVYVRFMADDLDIFGLTRVSPDSINTRINLNAGPGGLAGFQQDPADPRVGITFSQDSPTDSEADTELRLNFVLAEDASRPIAGDATVSVLWLASAEGSPTARVDLWNGHGTFVRTIYDVTMTATEQVISGTFPATDLSGNTSFQLRIKSAYDAAAKSVAACQSAMVVFDRSGWEADSGWLSYPVGSS